MFSAQELRQKYLDFFKSKGHIVIPSASLIPENDPTVLFTTAGMHPLVPFLLGEKHPAGNRLTNVQKCMRTGDIDEVGDNSHHTFMEMLGNWSLGDYFKREIITWSWELLTSLAWLGFDPQKLSVTVFGGDERYPELKKDDEAADIWTSVGVPKQKIAFMPGGVAEAEDNWWGPAGQTGPCGPSTEMFYWVGSTALPPESSNPRTDRSNWLEIVNDVFMQYNKNKQGQFEPLKQKNVDTGMGFERMMAVLNNQNSAYETELFLPIIGRIQELSGKSYTDSPEVTRSMRIIADHVRAATFILGDERGVSPSNVDQGYVLRRIIRRAIRFGCQLGIEEAFTRGLASMVVKRYSDAYPELQKNQERIFNELEKEEEKFSKTLAQGLRKIEVVVRKIHRLENILTQFRDGDFDDDDDRQLLESSMKEEWLLRRDLIRQILESHNISEIKKLVEQFSREFKLAGKFVFDFYTQDGFPPEMIAEIAQGVERQEENYPTVKLPVVPDMRGFEEEFKKHQNLSRAGAEQKFKGGLADHSEQTTKLHTATHLLQAALRKVLGSDVYQRGSNITTERLRFDFSYPNKMTSEQVKQVEDLVNEAIKRDYPVTFAEMTVEQAKSKGAMGLFEGKYEEQVKVYTVGDPDFASAGDASAPTFSMEICGGPHVTHTGELGSFRILKEEASSAGVRRIKAIVG